MYQKLMYTPNMKAQEMAGLVRQAFQKNYVVHISNIPFSGVELHSFYEEMANYIGQCLELGESVSSAQVSGYWTNVCYDPTIQNAYRSSSNAQPLHTDGSYQQESPDATCMYCIANASQGGETVFISGETLITALQEDNPVLLDQLFTIPVCFSRSFENGENKKVRPVIEKDASGRVTLTWNYYRVDINSSAEVKAMCEEFHQYLQRQVFNSSKLLALHLKPSEGVIWLDERVLHGRNGFVAHAYGERNLSKTCLKLM